MVNIPVDVMLDICVRLPVKSVGRFRCANKTWYKLLNDREFVQKHLYHATEMNRSSLMSPVVEDDQYHIYTIDYDPSTSTCTGWDNTKLPFIVNESYVLNLQFLGYCNGWVCLSPYNLDVICLWNPSIKEYIVLPEAPLGKPFGTLDLYGEYFMKNIHFGFGYDNKIGEFKVVCLTKYVDLCSKSEVPGSVVFLYTLGLDTWKTLESIPYIVYCQPDVAQMPVNGAIHWEAYREYEGSEESKHVILSFDFEKESFQEMPWPDMLSKKLTTNLCVLGGSLCISGFNRNFGVEVWEYKECKGRKSWIKLFTIDRKKHFGLLMDFVPLQSLQNGEFLIGFDTKVGFHVHQYNPKHGTHRPLFLYKDSNFKYSTLITVYVESLVSLRTPIVYVNDCDDDADSNDGDKVEES